MFCEHFGISAHRCHRGLRMGAATLVFVLAYLPNLRALVTIWNDDPNYTHGYLVIPIALYILWQQLSSPAAKDLFQSSSSTMVGLGFSGRVLVLRAILYERGSEWSENATIIPAIAALTWSFGSWPLLSRVWPAIAFLVFMLPLPQIVNELLALPLQSLAASSSRFLLQLTGMWVIQEGNVINLSTAHGMERLDVALACNGLRMLMTMAATVMATVILLPLPNWKRITLASQHRADRSGQQHGPDCGHRVVLLPVRGSRLPSIGRTTGPVG